MAIEESLQKGVGLAGQGMLHQALAIFEEILKASPDEPHVLFNAAVINNRLGYEDRALILLQRSIAADSSFANPYYHLGQLYLQKRCYQEAYQAFRNTIARDIEFAPAYEGARSAASAMGLSVIADEADVIFYTGGYPFHGRTMEEKGLGGSESALIYIARALAAKGIKVRVFCNCEKPDIDDGVRTTIWWIFTFTGICINCQCSFPPDHYGLLRLIYRHSYVSFGYMMILMSHF